MLLLALLVSLAVAASPAAALPASLLAPSSSPDCALCPRVVAAATAELDEHGWSLVVLDSALDSLCLGLPLADAAACSAFLKKKRAAVGMLLLGKHHLANTLQGDVATSRWPIDRRFLNFFPPLTPPPPPPLQTGPSPTCG